MIYAKSNWIHSLQPRQNASISFRLFCFPHSGAGVSNFSPWAKYLPHYVDLCCIQLPGRERRIKEPLIDHLTPIIDYLIPELLPYLVQPFAFLGHSLGALISFELARQLYRHENLQPLHLFVSGREAPQIPPSLPLLHQLSDLELVEEIRRFNGTPETILQEPELIKLFLAILRADLAVNEKYEYLPAFPLNIPITAFGGKFDHKVSLESLSAWQSQTCSSFNLHMFSGGHFFFKDQPSQFFQTLNLELKKIKRKLN